MEYAETIGLRCDVCGKSLTVKDLFTANNTSKLHIELSVCLWETVEEYPEMEDMLNMCWKCFKTTEIEIKRFKFKLNKNTAEIHDVIFTKKVKGNYYALERFIEKATNYLKSFYNPYVIKL